MPIRFSLREHGIYMPTYNPQIVFSKPSGSSIRCQSTTEGLGNGYIFVSCDRQWLHNKWIRFRWQGYSSWFENYRFEVFIQDGEYVRSNDTDFPNGSGFPSKGNGKLQTLVQKGGTFSWETQDIQADVDGGSEERCTIFFQTNDAGFAQSMYFDIDWLQINESSGGTGTIYSEEFDDSITMERSGTYKDYGYISTGDIQPCAQLPSKFIVRNKGFKDLSCSLFVGKESYARASRSLTPRRAAFKRLPCSFRVGIYSGYARLSNKFIVSTGAGPRLVYLTASGIQLPDDFSGAVWVGRCSPGSIRITHLFVKNIAWGPNSCLCDLIDVVIQAGNVIFGTASETANACQFSLSQTGPWTSSVDIGSLPAGGPTKTFWLKWSPPSGSTYGAKIWTLKARGGYFTDATYLPKGFANLSCSFYVNHP